MAVADAAADAAAVAAAIIGCDDVSVTIILTHDLLMAIDRIDG